MDKPKKYVIQRRFQNKLMKDVGGAMNKIFDNPSFDSLHVCEEVAEIETKKPLTKTELNKICGALLKKAKSEENFKDTILFEVVPYEKSMSYLATGVKANG